MGYKYVFNDILLHYKLCIVSKNGKKNDNFDKKLSTYSANLYVKIGEKLFKI